MAVNKIEINGEVKLDLTGDTVSAAHLETGYTAHDKAGNHVTGTMDVATIYTGSSAPDNGTWADGDIYLVIGG